MMSAKFALCDDLTGIHDDHAVGNGFEKFDAVLDDQHRHIHFLRQHAQDLVDLVDLGIDQAGRRLVHQQNLGPPHQQAGQQQLAPLEGLERHASACRRAP